MVIKTTFEKLAIEYNNKKNNKSNHENNTRNRDCKNLKKLPWMPTISSKIKREFKKIRKYIASTAGKKQILCQKNKPKPLPNSQPGIAPVRLLMQ